MSQVLVFLMITIAIAVTACSAQGDSTPWAAAQNPNVPGATGRTIVIGSHSSMADSQRIHPDWGAAGVDAQRGD